MAETWIKGRNAAARTLGIKPSTLRLWMTQDGFPDCSNGHPIETINAWREQRCRKGSEGHDAMAAVKLAREVEQLEHDRIKTLRDGITLAWQRGELYPRPATELTLSTFFTLYADGCEQIINSLPSTAAVPRKHQPELRRQLRNAIESLSTTIRKSIAEELGKLQTSQLEAEHKPRSRSI